MPDLSKIPTTILQSGDFMVECKFFDKNDNLIIGTQIYGQIIYIPGG